MRRMVSRVLPGWLLRNRPENATATRLSGFGRSQRTSVDAPEDSAGSIGTLGGEHAPRVRVCASAPAQVAEVDIANVGSAKDSSIASRTAQSGSKRSSHNTTCWCRKKKLGLGGAEEAKRTRVVSAAVAEHKAQDAPQDEPHTSHHNELEACIEAAHSHPREPACWCSGAGAVANLRGAVNDVD